MWKSDPHCGDCRSMYWQDLCPHYVKLAAEQAAKEVMTRYKWAEIFLGEFGFVLPPLDKIVQDAYSHPFEQVVPRCPQCSVKWEIRRKTRYAKQLIDKVVENEMSTLQQ